MFRAIILHKSNCVFLATGLAFYIIMCARVAIKAAAEELTIQRMFLNSVFSHLRFVFSLDIFCERARVCHSI